MFTLNKQSAINSEYYTNKSDQKVIQYPRKTIPQISSIEGRALTQVLVTEPLHPNIMRQD
jgi:hypothetical protein